MCVGECAAGDDSRHGKNLPVRWDRRNRAMARRRIARPHRSMSYLSSGTRTSARIGATSLSGKGIFLPGQGRRA
ncbi:hypothetical protein MM1S1540310_1275 [Mycobacteroides abscessus subsp. bolletii 1S-154-0310]|uniref:Uncharacterized protein n=1 Tax=Mycobacteroides abscessus MAB_091912_2446 TaxID=1335414 RepID=A0A829MD30_9MYCO|nr:hypothetical protein CAK77_08865 [Mycobacteroides abscessus subsp. massiliense]AWG57316.1 hypothetical protein DDT53_12635 [Mycobacteroides abscessus]EHM19108.1 hypothetical protein MMAS_16650 [Mycobacteroides abscessus subsp. massiliense CCUG 48898 = JCM 15300]EHM21023.1 hypothetical protein MBOL_17120 [Mycobacteroides abscessus subsp. bolletii BD]EIU15330.1 hypothetical protein MA5S0304_0764 [Mycobacteroides abscessus 5S-0304]EIU33465.1 hypothetical protein MA5S0817_0794 [Mycobacteroides 